MLLLPLDTSEGSSHLEIPDTRSEPPDVIIQKQEPRRELRDGMAKMPKKDREVLSLRFFVA